MHRLPTSSLIGLRSLIAALVLLSALASCSGSHDVVSHRLLQKRKYMRGFHWSRTHSKTSKNGAKMNTREALKVSKMPSINEAHPALIQLNTIEKQEPTALVEVSASYPSPIGSLARHETARHLLHRPSQRDELRLDLPETKAKNSDDPDEIPKLNKIFGITSIVAAAIALCWAAVAVIAFGIATFITFALVVAAIFGGTEASIFTFFMLYLPSIFAGTASAGSVAAGFVSGLLSTRKSKIPVTGIIGLVLNALMILAMIGMLGFLVVL